MENENPIEEAKLIQSIETNDKLETIGKNTEASLLVQSELKDAIEELKAPLDAIVANTIPEYKVQQVEIKGISVITLKGDKGDKPTNDEITDLIKPLIPSESDLKAIIEPLIPEPIKGTDGLDYVLTNADKSEIASLIEVPIVEKIIEKTETIIEKPITIDKTKTVIKEVAKYEEANTIGDKINTLSKYIDFKVIKNFPDFSKNNGGNGIGYIREASDVNISNAVVGQGLVWNGQSWVNGTVSGSSSPLTTKGDLYTYSTLDTRLPVGTNGQVLSANSATATGLEWIAAPTGLSLQTNGTPNGDQTLLNLIQGTGINIVDNGAGGITISSSGGSGTVTSFSFTDGNGFTGLVTNSTTTPTLALTLQDANTSQSGQLTSTDWNTFNNKVSSQWVTTGSNIYYSTGNVGIGTDATNPTELLFVRKDQDNSTNAHFKNLSAGTSAQTQLGVFSDTGSAFFQVLGSNYSYQNSFYGGSSALQSYNRLVFTTDSNVANGGTHSIDFMTGGYDSTTQRRMTIDSTGNVGIGTNITISAKLHTIATTEQFRLGYDTSNYLSHTVGSTGTTTFNTASTATNIFDWQYNGVTKYTLDKTGVTTATDVSSGGTIYTVVGRQRDTSQNDYYLYSYVVATDSRIALALGRFNGQGYIKLGSGPYDNATLGANYAIWNGSYGNEGLEVNTQGALYPYVGRWAVLGVGRYNSSYDTVEAGLRVDRNSDGTPQAGFGSAVLFQNQSTTTVRRDAGQISSMWSDATDASRTAEMVFSTVYNGGSLAEGFRLLGNGVSKLSFDGSNYFTTSISNTGDTTFTVAGTNADFTFSQAVNFSSDVIFGTIARLKGYTVATLPIAPVLGDMVYVTDALAPAFGVAVAGGGAANAKLWYNGANWTVTGV